MDDTERYLFLGLIEAVEEWSRKKAVLAELKRALERGH